MSHILNESASIEASFDLSFSQLLALIELIQQNNDNADLVTFWVVNVLIFANISLHILIHILKYS